MEKGGSGMSSKNLPGGIDCEEARKLAELYFADLGGKVISKPYLDHVELCADCRTIHQRRIADLWELGEVTAVAFSSEPETQEQCSET